MATISLAAYVVRVRELRSGAAARVDDFGDGDLLDVFRAYLEQRKEYAQDEDEQKVLRVDRLEQNGRTLSGIIQTGEYGYSSELLDVDSGALSYHRSPHEAVLLPFYFVLRLPRGANEGVLLLQRFQNLGIRGILRDDFTQHFRQVHDRFVCDMSPLVAPEAWRSFLGQGRLLKIRFIKFEVPHDVADALDVGGHEERIADVEYVIRARRNSSIPLVGRIREFMEGDRNAQSFLEIQGFEYDTVRVEVDFDGHRRTITLTDLGRLRTVLDITDEVDVGADGHPAFDSIDEIGRGYVTDLEGAIGEQGV